MFESWKARRESRVIAAEHEVLDQALADLEGVQVALTELKDNIKTATEEE